LFAAAPEEGGHEQADAYEEEDTCMSYEEEDTCMSYEEGGHE
jgi:hypothetical protein